MRIADINVSAYLDEAGEDPQSACQTLASHNIHYAILRDAWTGNVCTMSDNGHSKLKSLLASHGISAIAIASTLGKMPVPSLSTIDDKQINECINICKYYNSKYLRVFAGENDKHIPAAIEIVNNWMKRISEACVLNGIKCLYEVTSDSAVFQAADVAKLLSVNKNVGLVYDSAGLIIKQNFNPFIRHWPLIKSHVEIIDVRDVKIGHGFKVAGLGDAKIDMTIKDAIQTNYKGWFAIEPSFGRKFATATTKQQTFAYAVEGLDKILEQL